LVLLDSVRASEIDLLLLDQSERAVRRLDASLSRIPLRSIETIDRPYFRIAAAYAKSRRVDRARALLQLYDSEVRDTLVRRRLEHERRWALGEIALAEGRPLAAVPLFRQADVRADGGVGLCAACLYLRLARAFDAARRVDSAVFYFERYLTTPSFPYYIEITEMKAEPIGWVHSRLGELYELKGDRRRATAHYRQVADLWKDADAELQPKVAEARRRATS
jgi:tetratricopeptide (TPR) repeat protein